MSKEEQNEILSKRVATKKVRCKNWPNCKDPNCIYAHPTETVSIYFNFNFIYSAHIFRLVCMEINVAIYIQIYLANMDVYVLELDVPTPTLQGLILEWVCFLI